MRPVSTVHDLPHRVPFVAPEELERRLGVRFRARLGANESVWGPSPSALEAIASLNPAHYGDPQGLALRARLAEVHEWPLDGIVLGPGIDGLLMHLARAFLDPSRKCATSLGSYPTWEFAVAPTGAEVVRVPYRDDSPDLVALARTHAEVIYLANPDNPSGAVLPPREVEALRPGLLVLDEAYADFAEDLPRFTPEHAHVIRLRTFSKAHGLAGLRIAVAFGAPSVISALEKVRAHFEVNAAAQAAALASLDDGAHLAAVVEQTRQGREALAAIGARAGLPTLPSSTNFVCFDLATRERADAVLDRLLRQGVFVRKPSQPPLDRCIRVTVGTESDHQIFEEALTHALKA